MPRDAPRCRPIPRTIHPPSFSKKKKNISRLPKHGTKFLFELTGDRGAALVTRHQTISEDASLETAFEVYTKRHYKSWVEFARHKQYGNDVRPFLVSGFDMTRDFAMVAYSNRGHLFEPNDTIAIPMFASTLLLFRGRGALNTKYILPMGHINVVPPHASGSQAFPRDRETQGVSPTSSTSVFSFGTTPCGGGNGCPCFPK